MNTHAMPSNDEDEQAGASNSLLDSDDAPRTGAINVPLILSDPEHTTLSFLGGDIAIHHENHSALCEALLALVVDAGVPPPDEGVGWEPTSLAILLTQLGFLPRFDSDGNLTHLNFTRIPGPVPDWFDHLPSTLSLYARSGVLEGARWDFTWTPQRPDTNELAPATACVDTTRVDMVAIFWRWRFIPDGFIEEVDIVADT